MHMRRLALASAILLAVSTAASAQSGPPPRVHNRTLSTVTEGGRQVFRLDGVDETTYEAIYFRPFNFATDDPARRLRAVQYVGQIVPEGGGDRFEGRIVVVDKGATIDITLGPRDEPLFAARGVRRAGDALTFEADAPSDTPNHLAFAVTVRDGALAGTVTQTRDGQVRKARVAFTKQ
jgi:hypothetical protein